MRRLRAAALVTAIVLALVLSLTIGAGISQVGQSGRTNWAKARSEAALLLAEAAINDELSLMNRRIGTTGLPLASAPSLASSGQPYVGRIFSMPGVPGTSWVSTTSDLAGTMPWTAGSPAMYIQATAVVQGSRRKVRVGGAGDMRSSAFGLYAIFGANTDTNGNQASIGLTGNATVIVTGGVGTNGRVQGGSGLIDFDFAWNCNTAALGNGSQFDNSAPNVSDPVYSQAEPRVFPTVTSVLRTAFPAAGSNPWSWLATNNTNDRVRIYQSSLPARTPSGTKSAGFLKSQTVLNAKNANINGVDPLLRISESANGSKKYSVGSWSGLPLSPTGSRRTLIFPPGDYYLTSMEIDYASNLEFLIDDAGLTVGGNPAKTPVRLWFNQPSGNTTNDYMEIALSYTSAPDPKVFRIYYNKGGGVLEFARTSQAPSGPMNIFGGVYAIADNGQTQISFRGDTNNSNNTISLIGSLIADRVASQGYSRVTWSPEVMNPIADPIIGYGYSGGYADGL